MATVNATRDALKELARLPPVIRQRIRGIFKRLESWPDVSGAKPLSGNLAGWYRIRTSDYRVRFRVKGDTVIVDKIAHRKDVYED
jgi:mRNA interferase RelE/StbE